MKLKSTAMHFEIMTGSTKPSGYIRNSYREGGVVKHQTIARINGLSLERLENMKAAFEGKTIKMSDIKVSDGREFGASNMLFGLAKKIGLDKLIYSRSEQWVRCALAMIIGRIIFQGSKLSLSQVPAYSCLWEVCGINDVIDVDKYCYDAMDELLARQELIQKKLARKHLSDHTVILYDITSSYFEGEYEDSEYVNYGYNRDKKRGHKQIVIALICSNDGCPVAVDVFPGNTNDSSTVQGKIAEIRDKYGVSDFVFVGDRGMLTQTNIASCAETQTVTALTHAAMRQLVAEKGVQLSLFDENATTEVVLPEEPNVRYALRKNPVRAEKERTSRTRIIEKTEELLSEIAEPKRKTKDKTLAARAAKIFSKYKTGKYFTWDVVDGKIVFSRKAEKIADEEKYDGLYVIRSDVSAETMTISEVVEAYKSLANVEQAFRNMKTVQLEMRPMFHKTDDRIKAHVFICMLAYYLLWNMNKALKPLYSGNPGYTHNQVIEIMKSLQKSKLTVENIVTEIVAEPNDAQCEICNAIAKYGCGLSFENEKAPLMA